MIRDGVSIMMRYFVASLVAFSFVALVSVTLSAQQGFGRTGGREGTRSEGQQKYLLFRCFRSYSVLAFLLFFSQSL